MDLESRSEALLASYASFLSEIVDWLIFKKGNEQYIAHGVHFLFENRPMIDVQIGNEQPLTQRNFFAESVGESVGENPATYRSAPGRPIP